MTGQDLFYALSFVDERYIQEADSAKLSPGIPWMKILSVAACLCILLVGAFALEHMNFKSSAPEAAPEAAAPQAAPEAAPEAAPLAPESAAEEEPIPPYPVEEEVPSGELQHVPFAHLRVVKMLEGVGFEAIVEADEPMEMDTQVTVVIDPSKVPGADVDHNGELFDIAEGDLLEISNGAYDPEQNILYVSHVLIVEE